MNSANLLPIGSVVTVKEANKSMMIIGILPINEGKQYDYIAVFYPEGYMTEDQIFLFNQDDIEKVHFLGFMDSEYQSFRHELHLILSEAETQNENRA